MRSCSSCIVIFPAVVMGKARLRYRFLLFLSLMQTKCKICRNILCLLRLLLAISPADMNSCFLQGCPFKQEGQRNCILKTSVLNAVYSAVQSVFCREYLGVLSRMRTADTAQMVITWKHFLSRLWSRQMEFLHRLQYDRVSPLLFLDFVDV